ncbi:MAG TPA: glucoamylase family protein, partial [Polyangiaceae bacterium]|nr:glucoamylase family protein [Polyangiaceae bacterium]
PRILPKFAFEDGIPPEYHTLVVVPTLLDGPAGLARLLEELEVRSLANGDEQLSFALLTDFLDADVEESDADRELLELARLGIERLNAGRERARYFLFHRRRKFDAVERRWLGWERKRGKLAELNRLLRGADDTSFQLVTAPAELLARVRFVITLDTDTELPLGVARRLVATLAHPLNRPWVDVERRRVRRGHAIVQPRVGTSPRSARRSIFARLSAGPPGIDPYTTAVSDVYQDLFAEGSFVGKGIYDVDAFESVMSGRVPENQLLSHDLLESIYARSALASDIEVLDEQPSSYVVAAGRQHRWTRGDWQLLPWLGRRIPAATGSMRNDFRAFDAWRVLDNLRRSLLASALVVLAASTWLVGGAAAWVGSSLVVAVFVVPVLGRMVFAFARSDSQLEWLGGLSGDLKSNAQLALVELVFLLDRALLDGDAIVRALHRQFVSRRRLLEWTSMRAASSQRRGSVLAVPRLLVAAGLAIVLVVVVALSMPSSLWVAVPMLALWVAAPWVAARVSRVEAWAAAEPWGPDEAQLFRRVARKTWRFFERFVGELDNHLPPDNFQEDPRGIVAHRTSPTNMGLYLLSVASARDLGFITLREAVERWQRTLSTIEKLEKREGHVLNWYDTKTLAPLEPRYVSTVDSGNLAGYLWTLVECCRDLRGSSWVSSAVFEASLVAARLARESLTDAAQPPVRSALDAWLGWLERAEAARAERPSQLYGWLAEGRQRVGQHLAEVGTGIDGEARHWFETSARTLFDAWSTVEGQLPHLELLQRWRDQQKGGGESEAKPPSEATLEDILHDAARPDLTAGEFLASVEAARGAWRLGRAEFQQFEAAWSRSFELGNACASELDEIGARAEQLAASMNFTFLYDGSRALFAIGYNVSSARLDNSHYDLLASEARLASLVAIAKGDVPEKHWFRLGRLRARYASVPGLLSWSGSMFEYLMPLLVMRSFTDTLLDQTCHAAIEGQIAYGRRFGVPWGISEAAYNVMDLGMNYQYRAFGVPGLGLKPGLGEDLVVAPYATALAALVRARAAAENLARLAEAGLEGPFGFYESVDYTPARLPPGRDQVVIKAFMAHHQGMTLVALSNLLCDFAMQRRFHADPRIRACALLLEERTPPRAGVVHPETPRITPNLAEAMESDVSERLDWTEVRAEPPRGHLLGQ